MTDNPWGAWLREQEGAQVLPGGATAAGDGDGEGARDEFRGGPFGWDLAPRPDRPRRNLLVAAAALWLLLLLAVLAALTGSSPSSAPPPTGAVPGAAAEPVTAVPADAAPPDAAPADAAPADAAPADAVDAAAGNAADAVGTAQGGGVGGLDDVGAEELWPGVDGTVLEPGEGSAGAAAVEGLAGEGGVGPVGALLVRAALSAPAGPDGSARYVDAAAVTDVAAAGEAQVVTVLALVLTGDGRGWEAGAVERYAVAVGRDPAGSYRALAGPWALGPADVPDAPAGTSETDPGRLALAAGALEDAGYRDLADLSLLRDAAHPGVLIARATALAPGATGPADWTVWLHDTDTPTVLGSG